jgi:hypothetical protein
MRPVAGAPFRLRLLAFPFRQLRDRPFQPSLSLFGRPLLRRLLPHPPVRLIDLPTQLRDVLFRLLPLALTRTRTLSWLIRLTCTTS